jgi:beta,beta-carotene 9',10'-dioxygenase
MNSTLSATRPVDFHLGLTTLDQEISVDALPITGTVPAWLEGSLLRNGPAKFEAGDQKYRHWFDGLAMLHRFTFGRDAVSYANRFLRSPAFLESERTGRIAMSEFATDPRRSLIGRIGSLFGSASSNNANVNIVPYQDGYLALTETPSPVAFDGTTLETRGVLNYDDDVSGQVTTAHTHYDRERRATYNIVIEFGRNAHYKVVRIDGGSLRRTVIASIAVDKPAYLHAFSTTGRYVIIVEYPFVARPIDLAIHRRPFIENYRWAPERSTRFHVIDKDGGALLGTYETDAFFAFHHVNAFDDGDAVTIDIAAYDDASIVADFMLQRMLDPLAPDLAPATLRRYRLVPGTSQAEVETLSHEACELPRIAPAHAAKPYRYAYGVDIAAERTDGFFNQIVKFDIDARAALTWSAPHVFPGEAVFVPRPGGIDEDDGAVLCVVLDAEAETSYLLVLDGRSFHELARVAVPHHIPFGFHGLFR